MGYAILQSNNGTKEWDTLSCVHCQAVIRLEKYKQAGGFCSTCHGPVCDHCAAKGVCSPWKEKVEMAIKRLDLRR